MISFPHPTVDFDGCKDVAIRELVYMHDHQVLLQALHTFFAGEKSTKELPITLYVSEKTDFDSFEDGR